MVRGSVTSRERKGKMKKHPDVIAWNKWLSSVEGKTCMKDLPGSNYYLENRLWYAFNAGIAYLRTRNRKEQSK